MFEIGATHYLVVAALLFALGVGVICTRRNAIGVLLGTELLINAAGLNFVTFGRYHAAPLDAQVTTAFLIVLAAANAAVTLAILFSYFHSRSTIDVDLGDSLRG